MNHGKDFFTLKPRSSLFPLDPGLYENSATLRRRDAVRDYAKKATNSAQARSRFGGRFDDCGRCSGVAATGAEPRQT